MLVCLHGAGAVTQTIQKRDQPPHDPFVERHEHRRLAGPLDGCRHVARGLAPLDENVRRPGGTLPQASTLLLEPALELVGARQEESFEEVAVIERKRLLGVSGGHGLVERARIAPEGRGVQADFLVATARQRGRAERLPQTVKRLAQRRPCVVLVQVGPEQAEQLVTPMKAVRCRDGKVGKEGDAFRLGEHRAVLASVRAKQVQRSQRPKLDHGQVANARITPRSQSDDARTVRSPGQTYERAPGSANGRHDLGKLRGRAANEKGRVS